MQSWPDPFPWLAENAYASDMMHCGLYDRQHLNWDWHKGRVCMLGDACHAILPNAGQGAQLAMGDAILLSKVLAECDISSDDAVEPAFLQYHDKRHPFTTKIVGLSRALQSIQVRPPPPNSGYSHILSYMGAEHTSQFL